MNEEQIGRLSRQIADAPVPESVRARLLKSRQLASAQVQSVEPRGNVLVLLRQHPVLSLASLVLLAMIALTFVQQNQHQNDIAIDLALLTSDVPMEALLDPALLDRAQ
ncbi:DUF3619 family protein [Deefgea rivuli]|uniref:DUF3619 family protein n=1 Tax=Deefgea rivuli TaxID=400948 RepID=UPI000488657C|nr:DUF3619 family protein [Deefgea rivuli]